jgi:hypothetical protein
MQRDAPQVTVDEVLNALAHIQRRKLLTALLTHNPQKDESATIDSDESEDEELAQLIQMRHVHLPKLEDYGFINWDQNNNEVSKGPNFDKIRPVLELLTNHEEELPDNWL